MSAPAIPLTILLLTLSNAFVPFVVLCMRQPLRLDCLWAALCILGAVYFVFRE